MDAHQRSEIAKRSTKKRPPKPRPTGKFRFSDKFISRMTVILCIAIVVLPGIGIAYGITLDGGYEPWQGVIATGLTIGGFAVPLIAAAVLGGEAIRRGGGFVGFLFAAGLIAGPTGLVLGIPWIAIAGFAALAAGCVLFFVIGFAAKVPMWIGTPRSKVVSWNDPDDPNTTRT